MTNDAYHIKFSPFFQSNFVQVDHPCPQIPSQSKPADGLVLRSDWISSLLHHVFRFWFSASSLLYYIFFVGEENGVEYESATSAAFSHLSCFLRFLRFFFFFFS